MSDAVEPAASWFVPSTRHLFTSFAARYGSPIYLCGSALVDPHPTDFDVRVPVREQDLERLFGPDEWREDEPASRRLLRKWREELKQNRRLWRCMGSRDCNVDLQFQTSAAFLAHDGPRVRLDGFPDTLLDAGLGDP